MSAPFTRQLGAQSGVQLNPVVDNSGSPAPNNSDQVFAIAMRAMRGRVDEPFQVDSSSFTQRLGAGESIRANALNEAKVQVYEALNGGALAAVVHRLTDGTQINKFIVATVDATTGAIDWSLSPTLPAVPYLLALQHMWCFNDGLGVQIHADAVQSGGSNVAATVITLSMYDPADESSLGSFTGSLSSTAVDDYNQSYFLADIIANSADTPDFVLHVGTQGSIPTNSNAYGINGSTGANNVADSGVQVYFTEGGTSYSAPNYTLARQRLEATELDYGYISSGGNADPLLIAQLVQLSFDMNVQFRLDVPFASCATPAAAIAWVQSLGIDTYYGAAFWAPLQCTDPLNGGKVQLGTATLNAALACKRNSARDANGFAQKSQPIAGKQFPLNRQGLKQLYFPSQTELSQLAQAKINPVLNQTYTDGSRYVFFDSLTLAQTNTSYRKLISVADMSTSLDEQVALYAKEVLQLPMDVALTKMNAFLKKLFTNAQAAKWLRVSPFLNNTAFQYNAVASSQSPEDTMVVTYSLAFVGVARQITTTQTISR